MTWVNSANSRLSVQSFEFRLLQILDRAAIEKAKAVRLALGDNCPSSVLLGLKLSKSSTCFRLERLMVMVMLLGLVQIFSCPIYIDVGMHASRPRVQKLYLVFLLALPFLFMNLRINIDYKFKQICLLPFRS